MSIKELLFSFQGRIGRKTYWIWNVIYYVMIAGFVAGVNVLFPSVAHLLLPLFLIVLLLPDLAITAKRWHDRDKSSWWLLLNIPLVVGRMTVPMSDPTQTVEPSMLSGAVSLIALACGVFILVQCGLLKGTNGQNQYGPEPK